MDWQNRLEIKIDSQKAFESIIRLSKFVQKWVLQIGCSIFDSWVSARRFVEMPHVWRLLESRLFSIYIRSLEIRSIRFGNTIGGVNFEDNPINDITKFSPFTLYTFVGTYFVYVSLDRDFPLLSTVFLLCFLWPCVCDVWFCSWYL